jgi:branched-chain amino acid transport system permease protein
VLRPYSWPVMVLGVVLAVIVTSVLTERVAFRSLRDADPVSLMIASFAVSLALQNLARMTVLPRARGVPPHSFLTQRLVIGDTRFSVLQLVTLVTIVLVLLALGYLLQRTPLGAQLRAAAENFEMTQLLGVRANLVIISAFAITGALAGIAAVLLVSRQGTVAVEMGLQPLLIAFVGAVIGGLGSLRGAAIGGFLLGATTTLLEALLPSALVPFRDAFVFAGVIGVLALRPQGLVASKQVRLS